MVSWLTKRFKIWRAELAMPIDELFDKRGISPNAFGRWLIVELSGAQCAVLLDQLHLIQTSDSDLDTKGKEVMALRYQSIAMSLRTTKGKIPLQWTSETDLLFLANFPHKLIYQALSEVAKINDLSWLDPNYQPQKPSDSTGTKEPVPLTDEEIEANPS